MRTGVFEPTTIWISAGPQYRYAIRLVGRPCGAGAQDPRIPQTNAHKSANYRANTDSGRVGSGRQLRLFTTIKLQSRFAAIKTRGLYPVFRFFAGFFAFPPSSLNARFLRRFLESSFCEVRRHAHWFSCLDNPNAHFWPLGGKEIFNYWRRQEIFI